MLYIKKILPDAVFLSPSGLGRTREWMPPTNQAQPQAKKAIYPKMPKLSIALFIHGVQ